MLILTLHMLALNLTLEECVFCKREVEYEGTLGIFEATRFSTTGILVRIH